MNKKHIFLTLLVLLVVLTSCGQAPPAYSEDFYIGVKGVELEFVGSSPPEELYEGSFFPLAVLVTNEGVMSLNGSPYKGVISYSFDSFYLTANSADVSKDKPKIILEGKSFRYPSGDFNLTSLPSFAVNPIVGQRENPITELFVSACYPYRTLFSDEVCIDSSAWTQDIRNSVCDSQPKSYDSQGAPIAVTEIRPEMHHVGQIIRPAFFITIRNKGSGSVLAPVENINNACSEQYTPEAKKDWGKVKITTRLSNTELNCVPDVISLRDQEGVTRCYLDEGGFGGYLNYQTTLIIDLDYVYSTAISKEISIIRSVVPGYDTPAKGNCEHSWQTEINGKCYDNCDLCNENSEFAFCGSEFKEGEFGCNCAQDECLQILEGKKAKNITFENSNCIYGAFLCDGTKFCCRKQ